MKKIISAILSVVLLSALSMTAFAEDTTKTLSPTTLSGETAVTYTVSPAYTVTIPASVTLGETAVVSASNVVIPEYYALIVSVTGDTNSTGKFYVTNGGSGALSYTITDNDDANSEFLKDSSVLAILMGPTSGSRTLKFSDPIESPQFSGEYTGTLTFTIEILHA